MSKNKSRRTIIKDNKIDHSQLLAQSFNTKGSHISLTKNANRIKQRQKRCISMKAPSNTSSVQVSKVASNRKSKSKKITKNMPILILSEHQTPVLGKFFVSNNSNSRLPKIEEQSKKQNCKGNGNIYKQIKSSVQKDKQEKEMSLLMKQQQESTIKTPLSITHQKISNKLITPSQLQQNLDTTIDKLQSKQNTIQILNKTIQTRLVDTRSAIGEPTHYRGREDAYEIQMNFYIDKITQLQKELYEKNRLLKDIQFRSDQFDLVVRNNKKLLKENIRLKESLQLSNREVLALKKIVSKQCS